MRKFDTARVKQEEAIKDSSRQTGRIEPRLHLLAINLSLLIRAVNQLIVVLHLGLFLTDLDHTIEICNLHGEAWLLFLAIDEALVVIFLTTCTSPKIYILISILTPIHLGIVNRLCHALKLIV